MSLSVNRRVQLQNKYKTILGSSAKVVTVQWQLKTDIDGGFGSFSISSTKWEICITTGRIQNSLQIHKTGFSNLSVAKMFNFKIRFLSETMLLFKLKENPQKFNVTTKYHRSVYFLNDRIDLYTGSKQEIYLHRETVLSCYILSPV